MVEQRYVLCDEARIMHVMADKDDFNHLRHLVLVKGLAGYC